MNRRITTTSTEIPTTQLPLMQIYSSYDEEPEDVFLPLPNGLYPELYHLEMGGFQEDLPFYLSHLQRPSNILELGCGTGRLSNPLAERDHTIIGIDLSEAMVRKATQLKKRPVHFICMDMLKPALNAKFDAIIIPYNTLNLLGTRKNISLCLSLYKEQLPPDGQLLLHLYCIPENQTAQEPTFQFQMFDRPEGGKVIKEILHNHDIHSSTIIMTERYRVRPMMEGHSNIDYSQDLILYAATKDDWIKLLTEQGYCVQSIATEYDGTMNPSTSHGRLLLKCCLQY